MKFKSEKIDIDRIDIENKKYKIGNNPDCKEILFTPILSYEDGKFIPLSNFSAINRKKNSIWANVLDENTSPIEVVITSIEAQKKEQEFNIIEEAKALKLLKKTLKKEEYVVKIAEKIFCKKYNLEIIREIILIDNFQEKVKVALIDNIVQFKIALYLNKLKEKESEAILNLFETVHLSFSNQKKVINLTREIAKRDDKTIVTVLNFVKNILLMEISISEKKELILKKLIETRYPKITKYKEELKKKVKNLNIPSFINLNFSENFESNEIEVSFKFKNREELIKKVEALNGVCSNSKWEAILD